MAGRDAVVQLYQFDLESEPEGEAPEDVQTLRLQQDVSGWPTVCLQHSLQTLGHCSHHLCLQSARVSRLFTVTTKLHHNIINIKLASNAIPKRS